jgi:hypothetical protein
MQKLIALLAVLSMSACATAPRCPPQPIRTESVCVGQQTVIRYRDFLDDVRDKHVCPPVYVVTGQMCGR